MPVIGLLLGGASSLPAQREVRLEVALPPAGALATEGPMVRTTGVLSSGEIRDLLRSGFPARLHYRMELWARGGWFDDLDRATEWDVIVRQDALDQGYEIARIEEDRVTILGRFAHLADAEAVLSRPVRAPITARRTSREQYYQASLEIEILSLTDLDELQRWLSGEARPAVRGRRNPGTALGRGFRTLFARLLGGEKQRHEVRTPRFRAA